MADETIDPRYAGCPQKHAGSSQKPNAPRPIEGVVITSIKENVDDRQSLSVYLKASDPFFAGFGQSYVTKTGRGVVKAWHYHLRQTDVWYVAVGKIKVCLFDARKVSPTCGVANEVIMGGGANVTLAIPPGVFHGYLTLTEEAVLINTTNAAYDPSDEYRADWNDPRLPFVWEVVNR